MILRQRICLLCVYQWTWLLMPQNIRETPAINNKTNNHSKESQTSKRCNWAPRDHFLPFRIYSELNRTENLSYNHRLRCYKSIFKTLSSDCLIFMSNINLHKVWTHLIYLGDPLSDREHHIGLELEKEDWRKTSHSS